MFGNLTLGRPLGIRLAIHWSFWLLPLFVLFSNVGQVGIAGASVMLAVLFSVFACVALHELGHSAAAKLFGIRTRDIVLYPLGGVASLERIPRNPFQEIIIALAGPAVNVLIAGGLFGLLALDSVVTPGASSSILVDVVKQVLVANVWLVLFNLLPAFPMDGGRVLRATLAIFMPRLRATSIAAGLGTIFAVIFGVIGVLMAHPMLVIMAVFLFTIGKAEEEGVRAEEEAREQRQFFGHRLSWPIRAEIPIVTNNPPADGWVFNTENQMWTKWENGVAVARYRNP